MDKEIIVKVIMYGWMLSTPLLALYIGVKLSLE